MQIEGTIVAVLPLEQGVSKSTGNSWSKATVIVETGGQYPKKVALSNMKNAEEFSRLPLGTQATFKIDVESREYNGRWYSDVRCYAYEIAGAQAPQPMYAQPQQYAQPQAQVNPYQTQYAQPHPQPQVQQRATAYPPQMQDDDIPF